MLVSKTINLFTQPRLIILSVAFSSTLVFSCKNQSERTISDLENLVTEVRGKQENLSEMDWEQYDAALKQIEQQYADAEGGMTDEQKEKYNEALGRYSGIKLKSGLKNAVEDFQKGIENAGQQMQGMVEELADTLNIEE